MPDQSDVKIRFGDPRLAALALAFITAIELCFCVMTISLATATTVPGAFRVWFGLIAAIVLVGALALGLYLARNPRLISRTILVTPVGVLMPARRFGLIPVAEIAGVGLALQRGRGGGLNGNWVVAIWRPDGSLATAGGSQRSAQLADPTDSRVGRAARQLYQVVLDRQGPAGPLARLNLQRHVHFGPFEPYAASWDPSVS